MIFEMSIAFLAVDCQKAWLDPKGENFNPGDAVPFIKDTLLPFFEKYGFKTSEIISDYRMPRRHGDASSCVPGTLNFESVIPRGCIGKPGRWVKRSHGPTWTSIGAGDKDAVPGLPYEDPETFNKWLLDHIGPPGKSQIVLFGLTMDVCVQAVLQALYWRGYGNEGNRIQVLYPATCPMRNPKDEGYKEFLKEHLSTFGDFISFEKLKELLILDKLKEGSERRAITAAPQRPAITTGIHVKERE